jgi:thiol:disulfide interchange protein DsbD
MVKYGKSRLGFLELALAFKFLSNADLVLQLHLLEEKCFGYLDCNFGTLAFYLFGKITLPHDSPLTHIRRTFNVWAVSVNVYDIFNSGLWEHR